MYLFLKAILEKLCPLRSPQAHCPPSQSTAHLASSHGPPSPSHWPFCPFRSFPWVLTAHSTSSPYSLALPLPMHTASYLHPMQEGDHPPSLRPCVSAPGFPSSHSLFLGSLSRPQPAPTPHNLFSLIPSPCSPLSPAPGPCAMSP